MQSLRDVNRELDQKCGQFLMKGKAAEARNDLTTALKTYKDGLMWFPAGDEEHYCRAQLLEKIDEFGG